MRAHVPFATSIDPTWSAAILDCIRSLIESLNMLQIFDFLQLMQIVPPQI